MLTRLPSPSELLAGERELALRSTRLFGESGLSLSFDPILHYDVLDALDDEDFNELVMLIYRGAGKTTAIAAWLARKIARNRDFRALVVSSEDQEAEKIVNMTRGFLEAERIVEWYGVFENRRLWSKDEFTVEGRSRAFREPTLAAAGIQNYRAGGHYNCIVKDDINDEKNTDSAEKIASTIDREAGLVPMCDVGERLFITAGTFWDDSDSYMQKLRTYHLVREERHEDGSLRRYMKNNDLSEIDLVDGEKYRTRLFYKPIENEAGEPNFPHIHTRADLARIRMTMRLRPEIYAAQYKLDPIPTENAKFKPEDFRFIDAVPKGVTGDLWCGVDFASSLKAGSDYSAFVIALVTAEFKFYVLEAQREKLDSNQAIERLFSIDAAYPGIRFVIEEDRYVSGLKIAFEERMHQYRKFPSVEYINAHARNKKEARIEAMQGIFRAGSVYFLTGRCDILYDDLRRYPKAKKDAPDAMANVYEKAQGGAPVRQEEMVTEDRFLDVRPIRRSRLGDPDTESYTAARVRRMRAEDIPWKML